VGQEQGAAQEPGLDRRDGGAAAREPFGDLVRPVEGGELGLVARVWRCQARAVVR
jgi:hypothetical protein